MKYDKSKIDIGIYEFGKYLWVVRSNPGTHFWVFRNLCSKFNSKFTMSCTVKGNIGMSPAHIYKAI